MDHDRGNTQASKPVLGANRVNLFHLRCGAPNHALSAGTCMLYCTLGVKKQFDSKIARSRAPKLRATVLMCL
eukprot:6175053-Pleurochrysis_carterae.AAC.2